MTKRIKIITNALFFVIISFLQSGNLYAERAGIALQEQVRFDLSPGKPGHGLPIAQSFTSNPPDFPIYEVGRFPSLEAAISAMGAQEVILLIPKPQNIRTNLSVPSNVHLRFQPGGLLVINPGVTVTINGPLQAGLFQIFSGNGSANFADGSAQEVYPQWWGAKADGITNDTRAVQQSINAIAGAPQGVALFVEGKYLVDTIVLPSNVNIVGQGTTSIIQHNKHGYRFCFSINPNSEGTPNPAENKHDITIRNIQFRGTVDIDGFSESVHLLNINAATNVVISKCKFVGWRGDAIYLGSGNIPGIERHNQNIQISECAFDGLNGDNRNAISIIDGNNVAINKCSFVNCTRKNMPGAIDLEPNPGNSFAALRNIAISNNSFRNIGGFAGVISVVLLLGQKEFRTPPENISIDNNLIDQAGNPSAADGILLYQAQEVNDLTPQNKITVSGNIVKETKRPFKISGIKGVMFKNNTFEGSTHAGLISSAMPISSKTKEKCQNLEFTGNTFVELGKTDGVGVAVLNDVDRLDFIGNTFKNIGLPNGTFGNAISFMNGTANWVHIEGNHFSGSRTKVAVSITPPAKTRPNQNRIRNNTFADDQKILLPE